MEKIAFKVLLDPVVRGKHPKCLGSYDSFTGEYDCGYESILICEDCKYNKTGGRKDPAAKCNQED